MTGEIYIGSGYKGSIRLLSYFTPSVLAKNLPIYTNLRKYGHVNFCLAILEDLGHVRSISKKIILEREQFYLDILFNKYSDKKLNLSPKAGSTLGFKHSLNFKLSRQGSLNPMHGKIFSCEFLHMQTKDKTGQNNPMYGKIKSLETRLKTTKLVYVYDVISYALIGIFSTVNCKKRFNIGYSTLKKYLLNKRPYKGNIFSYTKLK